MSTQRERLLQLLKDQKLGQNAFERKVGLSFGTTCKQGEEITDNMIGKVLRNFRDVNSDWLIFGEGSMYKTSAAGDGSMQNVSGSHNSVGIPAKKFESEYKWFELVAQKDAQIERMQGQIDKLLSMIR